MTISYLYNKPIEYKFIPIDNNGIVQSISGIISARIYDSYPTLPQKQNTAPGHLQEVTSGTVSSGVGFDFYTLNFNSISDANQESYDVDPFYIVVNYAYVDALAPTFTESVIYLTRPQNLSSYLDTSESDIIGYENKLDNELDLNKIKLHIKNAEDELMYLLRSKGFIKRNLFNFENLKLLHIYKTLELCCLDLVSDNNTAWAAKSEIYKKKFESLFDISKINTNPTEGSEATRPMNIIRIIR